jgi:hypothetical protein
MYKIINNSLAGQIDLKYNLYNKEGLPASPFRTDRFDQ